MFSRKKIYMKNRSKNIFVNGIRNRSLTGMITAVVVSGIIFASAPVALAEGNTEWRQVNLTGITDFTYKPEAEETTVYSVSSQQSQDIAAINERLMELDYLENDEPSDSYMDTTVEAVQKFERKNGFEMDGILTQYEYDLLMSDTAERYSVGIGDSGVDVAELQERLVDLGFLDEVTGNYGIYTQTAVKAFQKTNKIDIDGSVNSETREKLYSEDAVGKALQYGDENDNVKIYQEKLKELGYYEGSVSGYFNSQFREAVKLFQSKNGLIADGSIGEKTSKAILSSNEEYHSKSYSICDSGSTVSEIQDKLKELGYMNSSTGYYGEKTEAAVKKFQSTNGLKADGKVNEKTLKLLLEGNPKRAPEKEETKTEIKTETKTEEKSETKTETKTETKSETKTEAKTEEKTETKSETKTEEKQEEEKSETKTETKTEEKKEEEKSETKTETKTEEKKEEETKTEEKKEEVKGTEATKKADSSKVDEFIEVAMSKLGCKYVLGAKGPEKFDCSGFVYWCLNQVGVKQSYMTSHGWKACTKYPIVSSMEDLQRGDIISYQGHVGIYIGNNKMIDASSSEGKIRITNIYSLPYWRNHFIKGVRVF